jgi:hypothetical protein
MARRDEKARRDSNVFPGRVTTQDVRVIGPNGTIYSQGEQSPWSNGFYPRGELGTGPTTKTLIPGRLNTNRGGEKPGG